MFLQPRHQLDEIARAKAAILSWLVIDKDSERRQIADRVMIGERIHIAEKGVWQNVAANLSRQTRKATAISVIMREQRHERRLSL
jgi:hypothetical protein